MIGLSHLDACGVSQSHSETIENTYDLGISIELVSRNKSRCLFFVETIALLYTCIYMFVTRTCDAAH